MLQLIDVSISFGSQTALNGVSLVVNRGDRTGIIGPNGCGKTTLLRIMAGALRPSSGEVRVQRGTTIGLLAQSLDPGEGRTVWEEMLAGVPGLSEARREVERLGTAMADASGEALARATEAYGAAVDRFESLGGYSVDDRIAALLDGLGLGPVAPDTPVGAVSGGQRTRLGLARLLVAAPDVLLLDEPTNHLDLDALEWLERFVTEYRGAVVAVSHDREFLDRTVARIVAIDQMARHAKVYSGNYSSYAEQVAKHEQRQAALFRVQQATISSMERDIAQRMQHARKTETGTRNDFERRIAKKVAKQAKARGRKLERFKSSGAIVDRPEHSWGLKLEFASPSRGGQRVVELADAGHAYGANRLFEAVNLDLQYGERVALLGPNGCGKSTLLRAIAGELRLSRGHVGVGSRVHVGFLRQEAPPLDPEIDALTALRRVSEMDETVARNYLHYYLFAGDSVFVPFGELSYGERQRLQLALIAAGGANCLLLDEPANHLDIDSRERLEHALAGFEGTIIAATHDRAFIDRWATGIWGFVRAVDGSATILRFVDRDDLRHATRTADSRTSP